VNVGRTLIFAGAVLIVVGLLFPAGDRLPGNITIRGRYGVFYFPVATGILISAILSLALWLLRRR
jgi:Protein of unknown function (DUF2905)